MIANVLSTQTEKSLSIPVYSEQLVRILESLASSLKELAASYDHEAEWHASRKPFDDYGD